MQGGMAWKLQQKMVGPAGGNGFEHSEMFPL
jgi:hypothetical protein